MQVVVTNLDGSETPYNFEPEPGRLDSIIEYYKFLSDGGNIRGFSLRDGSTLLACHYTF
jgi:hypothetical protein